MEVGIPVNVTATGDVGGAGRDVTLLGFYVNSTSSGTLVFRRGGSGGTVVNGTLTPAAGAFHRFPAVFAGGLHVTVGGTIDVTLFTLPGA
jgi:hypothetical protein